MKSQFPYMSGYKASWRDRAVARVINWVMEAFATTAYLNFITDLIMLGRTEFERRLRDEARERERGDSASPEDVSDDG